jgi:hypothetical protein
MSWGRVGIALQTDFVRTTRAMNAVIVSNSSILVRNAMQDSDPVSRMVVTVELVAFYE